MSGPQDARETRASCLLGCRHRLGFDVCQQVATGHPQVRQSKQGVQLLGVLSQSSVANFDVVKLALDDSEWVLDLGPDLGLHLLQLLLHGRYWLLRIQGLALAALHGDMPAQFALGCWFWHVWALVCALVTCITIAINLLPVQQAVGFNDIIDVGRCTPHGVYQARIRIHADMGLNAEIPLLAFLGLVHLRVA